MTGPVHFIGIGGYGMSSLAQYLLLSGVAVTGSDVRPSVRTERLAALGARIAFGHKAEHVAGAARVIYSTDVPEENVERIAARRHGIPVEHRSVLLAELLARGRSVAVTGTHGKTTTTAMIGAVLVEAGCDPTVFLGADYGPFGGNLRFGRGLWSVAEACESDASFLRYRPDIAVVTNLEPEHLDRYGDFPALVEAVRRFLGGVAADGCVVLCGDDPHLRRLA
ncbi:MAG TPA: Mur ligase domain-containing protein, partial [Planctomycetaceae bacterium]